MIKPPGITWFQWAGLMVAVVVAAWLLTDRFRDTEAMVREMFPIAIDHENRITILEVEEHWKCD